jgi:hypothetical protein
VKRYDWYEGGMEEWEDGEFVRYEDVEHLLDAAINGKYCPYCGKKKEPMTITAGENSFTSYLPCDCEVNKVEGELNRETL